MVLSLATAPSALSLTPTLPLPPSLPQVRGALSASRKGGAGVVAQAVAGFTPSTAALLKRYLSHVDPRF